MPANRIDPFRSYNFLVLLIDGSQALSQVLANIGNFVTAGFSECSGLESSLDIEEYQEGGRNDTSLKFPTRVDYGRITLRRGLTVDTYLWEWHHNFILGRGQRRDGLIILQNDQHLPVVMWRFARGIPTRYSGPTLNAGRAEVALEELEIVHEGLEMVALGTAV